MEGESAWAIKPEAIDWADEVEAEEVKKGPMVDEEAFPTLGEAVKSAPQKGKASKKGKGTKMGLNEFMSASVGRKPISDAEILMQLPKGSSGLPREERDPNALGGAFKDYGGDRQGFRRGDRGDREEREPSRADAAADWGAERKFTPSDPSDRSRGFGGGFGERRGGFGDRDREGGFGDRPRREERPVSEADTVNDWGVNRKFVPSSGSDSRPLGSGFRDRPRSGFPENGEPSRADTGDWGSRRAPAAAEQPGPSSSRRGYGFSEQPVSQADLEDRWSHRAAPAAEPAARPAEQVSERPRLKLAPRTKPLDAPAANGVAPSSPAAASPVGTPQQSTPTKKVNPFGAAKPREEVLKEKGIDYRKEELKLEHGEVIRDKTSEETDMEKEVEELRVRLAGLKELSPGEEDTISELAQELDDKEKALYKLQAELDDRIRYSKNRPDRSADAAPRSAAADDGVGFQEVRNLRKERAPAAAAAGQPADSREGGFSRTEGAWGSGGSGRGFRDRDAREGARGGRSGGSFRDREGPKTADREREGRDRRPAGGPPGRTAGGW